MDVLLAVTASHLNRHWSSLTEQPLPSPSESIWPLLLRLFVATVALVAGLTLLTLG